MRRQRKVFAELRESSERHVAFMVRVCCVEGLKDSLMLPQKMKHLRLHQASFLSLATCLLHSHHLFFACSAQLFRFVAIPGLNSF